MRDLHWSGGYNVRDLGGLPTVEGGATVSGRIVRGAMPDRLTERGWAALVGYGVRTVIDLREEGEDPEPLLPRPDTVTPVRVRKMFFSEAPADPSDPKSPTVFFITQEGQTPKAFDPSSTTPDIVVKQGDVEDWIIENRSVELHAFHIHQLHFALLDWFGLPVNEPFLRDTVNVPYFDNHMLSYPSVRLRMDFRDPNTVGTFAFHCHLLEHEDGGMMATIRVEPADRRKAQSASPDSGSLGAPARRKSSAR